MVRAKRISGRPIDHQQCFIQTTKEVEDHRDSNHNNDSTDFETESEYSQREGKCIIHEESMGDQSTDGENFDSDEENEFGGNNIHLEEKEDNLIVKRVKWPRSQKISIWSKPKAIKTIKGHVKGSDLEKIRNGCLGQFINMHVNNFPTQLMRHLILRQCTEGHEDELTFNFNGKSVIFGIRDFALVTGLNCGKLPRIEKKKTNGGKLLKKYWPNVKSVSRKEFSIVFEAMVNVMPSDDKVKLANLYMLENMVLGKQESTKVEIHHMAMLDDDDKFHSYPWGTLSYKLTIESIKKAVTNLNAGLYGLDGFPHALIIWAYETIPLLHIHGYAFQSQCDAIPRLTRWTGTSQPSWDDLESNV